MKSLLIAVLVLGFLVFIHELGHFMVAKISGMRVETFSIGMGPAISSFRRNETEYVIGAIPAGGFVTVTGAAGDIDDDLDPDDPRRYPNKPILQRALFAAAGPFMNIALAIVLLIIIFMSVGMSVPKEEQSTVIDSVTAESPAAEAGFQPGDRILSVNEQRTDSWQQLLEAVSAHNGQAMTVQYERGGNVLSTQIKPRYEEASKRYVLGVSKTPEFENRTLGFGEASIASIKMTQKLSTLILDAVGNLITGKTAVTDKNEGLTGPVGIVKVIDESASQGVWNVLMLMAVLSVNLGLLNLLPVPALDGSRLLFLLLEAVRGKPIDPSKEGIVNFIGFAFLIGLMIFVTYNDIARLF